MSTEMQAYPDPLGVVRIEAESFCVDIALGPPRRGAPNVAPEPSPEREPDIQTAPQPQPPPPKRPRRSDPTTDPIVTFVISDQPEPVWSGLEGEFAGAVIRGVERLNLKGATRLDVDDVEAAVRAVARLPWRLVGQGVAGQLLASFASDTAFRLLTEQLAARMGASAPMVVWEDPSPAPERED